MNQITIIAKTMAQGLLDSLTGTAVVFYLDREVNSKLAAARSSRSQRHSAVDQPQQLADGSSQQRHHKPSTNTADIAAQLIGGGGGGIVGELMSGGSGGSNAVGLHKKPEQSAVLRRVLNCCVLNGGVFWASILFFEYLCLPFLLLLLKLIFGGLGSSASAGSASAEADGGGGRAALIWSWMQPALSLLFGMVWVVPLFVLSRVVNALWFQDIANSAYKFRKGRPQTIGLSKLIADTLFSLVVQLLFVVQSTVVQALPVRWLGEALALVHMCLLYSLYAFEYKWCNMGWELHKRLTFIEYNWPYFLGFGMPLAVLTQLPASYVVSGCVFAILFPFFILSANEASPAAHTCSYPLKLFSPVVAIANSVFSKTVDTSPPQPPMPSLAAQRPLHTPAPPPPSQRPSVVYPPGFTPGPSKRAQQQQQRDAQPQYANPPQTVHGVDMSAFLSQAAQAANAAAVRQRSQHRGSPAPATHSHRSSPTASSNASSTAAPMMTAQQQRQLRR